MNRDERAGIAWWNAQSEMARSFWLDRAGPGASAADAYKLFKDSRERKAARHVAAEILDRHDLFGTELRDNELLKVMLAEAYERGLEDARWSALFPAKQNSAEAG